MWAELRETPEVVWGFGLAFVLVLLLTPAVGRDGTADRCRGRAERRRLNRLPIPRLGGLALFLGILVPSLAFLPVTEETRGLLLGATVATIVGALDDARGLLWWQKLGGTAARGGDPGRVRDLGRPLHVPVRRDPRAARVVGDAGDHALDRALMNMVNFLDGMDGLAAGVCAIAGATFAVIALSLGKPEAAIVAGIVAGACFGFLRHNFYPARIFMGDSGALLLGFVLATISVQGLLKTAATVALLFPLVVLAVPILDTTFVVLRRLKHGEQCTAPTRRTCTTASCAGASRSGAPTLDDVRLVRDPRRGGARDPVRPVPRERRVAPRPDPAGRRDRARGGRLLDLRRLPARDRQAGKSDSPKATRGAPQGELT